MNAIARFPDTAEDHVGRASDHILPSLHILTCGSVDDGKSTLIGRLLWDATDLYDDQRAALAGAPSSAGGSGQPDFSRLLDGLVAEREQGITIDVAWRYFDTRSRRIVVIDSPGHEQYTRNMASGASHADIAILLVDARHGIKTQTRRHAAILDLMGVKRVVLAVNKMDLAGYDASRFAAIVAEFQALLAHFSFDDHVAIPLCAVLGENVVARSPRMDWYRGPTLFEHLEKTPGRAQNAGDAFRMPVQLVVRDGRDFRGLAGTVAAGSVGVGDEIVEITSGRSARIARIATFDGDLTRAEAGRAVVIGLDRDLDIARGAVLAAVASAPPQAARCLEARLVWLAEEAFDFDTRYLLATATDSVPVERIAISGRLNLTTLAADTHATAAANDIAIAAIELGRPAALEPFARGTQTGSFLLVDAITGATVAGGVVTSAGAAAAQRTKPRDERAGAFRLDDALLASGLCSDLGPSAVDEREFARRRRAVIEILRRAGVEMATEEIGATGHARSAA